jgi:predicted nucleotide-binding protein
MEQQLLTKFQELIQQGEKLVPEGGLEFSGYNAKMQSQYLLWRKNCLDVITKVGEKATPFREKITKDENGAYFYQNSAQLILEMLKQSLPMVEVETKKNSTPTSTPPSPKATAKAEPAQPKQAPVQPAPPTPKQESQKPTPPPAAVNNKEVFVISSAETELQHQLTAFLKEIGIEPIVFKRGSSLDAIIAFPDEHLNVKYAYYLFTADDVQSAMFELGYLLGKIGPTHIVCIHKKEDAPPKGIPGIAYKEIVVKLEEISFGLIKDLKASGYSVSI